MKLGTLDFSKAAVFSINPVSKLVYTRVDSVILKQLLMISAVFSLKLMTIRLEVLEVLYGLLPLMIVCMTTLSATLA